MFQQLPQRQIPLRGTPLNQGRCWLSDDRYVPFFLSFSIIYVYATLSAQTTLLYSHIRFSTPGCRVFTHYYVPSLELLFSPLNICICLCGSFVVYLSLCPRAVLIWIIIWYSQIRSIINYYSKSLKTSTLQNISALCPRLSSHARQHYTFLATSQRKAHIEVAHHRCIISNSSIVIVRGS